MLNLVLQTHLTVFQNNVGDDAPDCAAPKSDLTMAWNEVGRLMRERREFTQNCQYQGWHFEAPVSHMNQQTEGKKLTGKCLFMNPLS
jgi:hypothetical protein